VLSTCWAYTPRLSSGVGSWLGSWQQSAIIRSCGIPRLLNRYPRGMPRCETGAYAAREGGFATHMLPARGLDDAVALSPRGRRLQEPPPSYGARRGLPPIWQRAYPWS
jgi:hypothetical protein